MRIDIETKDILEIGFAEFEIFYPLFNSGDKVLWFKEKDDKFILLSFIDAVPITCEVLKEDIIEWANLPDLYPETKEGAINEWRSKYLVGQTPKNLAQPFIRYGGIE